MFMELIRLILGILPAPVQVFVLAVLALFVIMIVLKLIALVLDAIPFL